MRAIAWICALAGVAHADDAVTTQPLELAARGGELGFEHHVIPHWSAMGTVGFRGAALGDYTSTTYAFGAEVRWWLRPTMTRLFVAAHASAGHTSVALAATGKSIGTAWGLEQRIDVGWRFTIRGRIAIAPSLGVGWHEDVDARLATYQRPALGFGLEVGCLL